MNSLLPFRTELLRRVQAALETAGYPPDAASVSPATDSKFGDYQSNSALVLAKRLRRNPKEVAKQLLEAVDVTDLCEPPEIAGAGFLNFRMRNDVLARRVAATGTHERLGVEPVANPRTIIIDFSSPNVAKPMHVGHIRSTILGDSLARIARFLGHRVITDNHLGDWGTQFGKILYGWKHRLNENELAKDPINELLRLYREVNKLEADDPGVAKAARAELVKLQSGDPENLKIWKQVVELSWKAFEKMYELLDVHFDEHLGESFYNEALGPLVERLLATGIAEVSEGAVCVFFRDIPRLADKPCIIRKSDGGYLYATTDLATLEYRKNRWNPDAIWYVAGAPQALHFDQVFEIARRMGLSVDARHVAFGSILGEDRKIMKTRSGENVQLADLLSEAISRAARTIREKSPDLPEAELMRTAELIGIGAVKYAELSQHRMTDYVFSWDKLLAFQGNTAPYLQNAYVRIRAIFRKAGIDAPKSAPAGFAITEPDERALAIKLIRFCEIVPEVLDDFRPNLLANYLYELAIAFHSFYENCPVLKATDTLRANRLFLCAATANTLSRGLELLGIRCPERM